MGVPLLEDWGTAFRGTSPHTQIACYLGGFAPLPRPLRGLAYDRPHSPTTVTDSTTEGLVM